MAESIDFAFSPLSSYLVSPIKLKSNSLTRKEKTTVATVALHLPTLSGELFTKTDGTSNC
jgi:hypothetical protein